MTLAVAPDELEVRDVVGTDELRACQQLQRRTWGITEDGYVVPVATLAAAQKMGGSVLGAFRDGRLVGFTFAFLGRYAGGELTLYSQLAAIDPDFQGSGIGRLLKVAQRNRAQAQGLATVTWTFDPLQAKNAAFNLAALGAAGIAYEVDLYGTRTDALNVGTATDRLVVQWPTAGEPRPGLAERPAESEAVIATEPLAGTSLRRATAVSWPSGRWVSIEAPSRIGELKAFDLQLAREWQAALRQAFGEAFRAGYRAVGFAREAERSHYLLSRTEG